MKYIKKYEDVNEYPKVGDYVILKIDYRNFRNLSWDDRNIFGKYINNTIGKIIDYKYYTDKSLNSIEVEYEDVPQIIINMSNLFKHKRNKNYSYDFQLDDMVDFATTKNELESKLMANKYNL